MLLNSFKLRTDYVYGKVHTCNNICMYMYIEWIHMSYCSVTCVSFTCSMTFITLSVQASKQCPLMSLGICEVTWVYHSYMYLMLVIVIIVLLIRSAYEYC